MGRQSNKQSKLMSCLLLPIRMLKKATDFYVKSLEDCSGRLGQGGGVCGPAGQVTYLPKSFSANSSGATDDDDIDMRQLLRRESQGNRENKANLNMRRQHNVRMSNGGAGGMGIRSYSVGLGKIGTIDEDQPCSFEEDEVNLKADLYPRSRSYAVRRNGLVS